MAPMENASGMKRVENIMKLATKYQTTDEVRQLSDKNKHHSIADTGSAATMPICKEAFPLHTIAESNAQGKSIESLRQTGGGGQAQKTTTTERSVVSTRPRGASMLTLPSSMGGHSNPDYLHPTSGS